MKSKQIWGKWLDFQVFTLDRIPIRVTIRLPFNWHGTHNSFHVKKYWKKKREEKPK